MDKRQAASPPEPDPASADGSLHSLGEASLLFPEERRRPGRIERVAPHLISLLRRPAAPQIAAPEITESISPEAGDQKQEERIGDFAPFRGIAFGLLLVAPFWVAIAALCWW